MKREAKHPGSAISCEVCGQTIVSGGNFFGFILEWFWVLCANEKCENHKKKIYQRINVNTKHFLTLGVIVIILFIIFHMYSKAVAKKTINCDAFFTKSEAQTFYDSNTKLYQYLDRNYNGIPCQNLK